jgi:glycosyltransferase involved in cell wall biosynthesis
VLRIAQVAPPFESVPPSGYGGTERVVAVLTEELVRRGHEVTLFAAGDSTTSAHLVPTIDRALWHQKLCYRDFTPFWSMVLGRLVNDLDRFDVIHSHLDYFGFPLARIASCPVVTTLHGRLDEPEMAPLYRAFTDVPLISISDSQRAPVPDAHWVATVYHGIDLDQFTCCDAPGTYLAFLGRISPEKGLDTAIRVARAAGVPLKIGARKPLPFKQDPKVHRDWEYYQEEIRPIVDSGGVEFIGEVDGPAKDDLLRNAAGLLFPIRWPEPFGLVMVEALACGTPVLALRAGSVPEIIEDGRTGYICDDEEQLVAAVQRLSGLDRRVCRDEAERRFSPAAMAERYEQVYERLLAPD